MNNPIYLQLISLNKTYNNHFLKRYVKLVYFFKQRNFKKKKFLHHEHHIIPQAFDGLDKKDNLVFITIREHFILHHLLYKAFPKSEMTNAFLMMLNCWGKDFRISSKSYEILMIESAKRQSETARKSQNKLVVEGRHNFSGGEIASRTQRKRVEEGNHHFQDKEKARERANKRVAEGRHIFQNPLKIECEYCKKTFNKSHHKNWHGDKCKLNPMYKEEIKPKVVCEYCNREFYIRHYKQYHGDKCKLNPLSKEEIKILCKHCNRYFYKRNFIQFHGDKCKLKPQT